MSKSTLSLGRAFALSEDNIFFAGVYEDWDVFEPATRMFTYRKDRPGSPWGHLDFEFHTAGMALYIAPEKKDQTYFIALSSEGEVYFHCMTDQSIKPHTEQIPNAGLENKDAVGYGRMTSIRQIGDRLYACGNGGQIYVRQAKNEWEILSPDILWDPTEYAKAFENEPEDEEDYDDWYDAVDKEQGEKNPAYMLLDINGPSENEIYICGEQGALFLWDGQTLEDADADAQGALTNIHVTDEGVVWICGRKGQLFSGNEEEGLEDHSEDGSDAMFTSITTYKNKVLLASHTDPFGLFTFNQEEEELERITPRLKPVMRTIHTIQAVGNVLWVIGTNDILRLENDTWERIQHPDMPVPQL